MDTITKQTIGFGIAMAPIFAAGSNSINRIGIAILFGVAFWVGFYAYRERKRSN
jgi:hypothetical protein